MDFNKAIVLGRLTQDPEERSLPSGRTVVNFGLATNRVYNDKDGNKQEDTEFHNIVLFGRTAEIAAQYLSKGSMCLIEGRLQTRTWEDKETGKKRYKTEIVGRNLQLGPKPQNELQMNKGGQQPTQKNKKSSQNKNKGGGKENSKNKQTPEEPEDEVDVEDIPF